MTQVRASASSPGPVTRTDGRVLAAGSGILDGMATLAALAQDIARPAHSQVADVLRQALVLRLFDSDRLPPERELASVLAVSRMTVRDALDSLKQEGYLTSYPGRGGGTFQVQRPRPRNWRRLVSMARDDIRELVEFRSHLEDLTVRLAARRPSKDLVGRLATCVSSMEANPDIASFRHSDSAFHLSIAAEAHNRRLFAAVAAARADLISWIDILPIPYELGTNAEEHRRIAQAIAQRDEGAASEALRSHLASTGRHILGLLR